MIIIYFIILCFSQSCVLHDLIIEYLQQSMNKQQLNKHLIDGYGKHCNGKWSTYPRRDYYHYQYIIQHAIQAEDDKTIQEIMEDFKWMSVKVQQDNTIYSTNGPFSQIIHYMKIITIIHPKLYVTFTELFPLF